MRTAQPIELRDAKQVRCSQRLRRWLGRNHHDACDARHLRGDGRHQQSGGQRMATAWHIATDRAKRAHKLTCREPFYRRIAPRLRQLANSESVNLLGCGGQRFLHRDAGGSPGGSHLFRGHNQIGLVCQPIELRCVAQQGAVATLAHIRHNALDGGPHAIERRAAALFERGQRLFGLPRASSFALNCFH